MLALGFKCARVISCEYVSLFVLALTRIDADNACMPSDVETGCTHMC